MDKKLDLLFDRIHLHITGSVSASLVPYWINWSLRIYPELSISVSVTKNAKRFVSVQALSAITRGMAWEDDWDSEYPQDIHSGLLEYTDLISIFPASINTMMHLSSGMANTPMQLALQVTDLPVLIAKSFPKENSIIHDNLERLISARDNFWISKEYPAYSLLRKDWSSKTGFYYPSILEEANMIFKNNSQDL